MFYSIWAALSVQEVSVNTLTTGRLLTVSMTLPLDSKGTGNSFLLYTRIESL
jgi:hypothetical protein